jgi:hypothetical protein
MGVVDDLLANPGLYLGVDRLSGSDLWGPARLVVTPLPGGSGVALDYEIFNAANPARARAHVEHTLVARTQDGKAVMVIGHAHAGSLAILRETDPGSFEGDPAELAFPMKVVVSVPEPGRLEHAWWYGSPGTEAVERDVAELTLTA